LRREKLPTGWSDVELRTVVSTNGVLTDGDWVESKDQDPDGDVRLIQLADIGDGCFRNRSHRFLTKEKALALGCTFLKAGDILIARMPDPLGRACIFPLPGDEKYVTVVDVCIVRVPESTVSNRYLTYAINSLATRRKIEALESGTTRKRISGKNLTGVSIPLAPSREQQRIVAKIEELFSKLDKGVESLKLARTQLVVYRKALLKYALEGKLTADWRAAHGAELALSQQLISQLEVERRQRWEDSEQRKLNGERVERLTNRKSKYLAPVAAEVVDSQSLPDSWSLVSMDSLTCRITSGSRDWQQYYGSGAGTFIMAQNVRPGRFEMTFRQIVNPPADDSSCERSRVEQEDLLVTIVGANTGNVCRVPRPVEQYYVCQSVALMRPVFPKMSKFLEIYFNSSSGGQHHYDRYIYGAGRPHLSFDQLRMTPVVLPSIDEQEVIVKAVENQLSMVEQLESEIDTNLKKSEALRQSILQKAFAGELVAQDPNDEPAAALLDRIRAERQLTTTESESKRRKSKAAKA
jgi:type I restriction enzyme S subunit